MGGNHCRALPLAVIALIASAAGAAEVRTQTIPGGIARLSHADGLGRGIVTGNEGSAVLLQQDAGDWFAVSLTADGLRLAPAAAPAKPERAPSDTLPDGQITTAAGDISGAWLIEPTDRYRHGILGDAIEAGGLRLAGPEGVVAERRLAADSVFEDRRVRIVDLDGDGRDEAVVVRSYADAGAALAVYGLVDGAVVPLAETPPIGLARRWLNPAGAADLDGDGRVEIAYVETPHIGGTLRLYEFDGGALRQDYEAFGFSNHAIGSREQDMAAILDWNGDGIDDLALPDARRTGLRIVSAIVNGIDDLDVIQHPLQIETAVLASDLDGDGRRELVYGLSDGTLVVLMP